jgi:hypothetical protein
MRCTQRDVILGGAPQIIFRALPYFLAHLSVLRHFRKKNISGSGQRQKKKYYR